MRVIAMVADNSFIEMLITATFSLHGSGHLNMQKHTENAYKNALFS